MTELEYEKACRGPRKPVANEWAAGVATQLLVQATNILNASVENETALPSSANSVYGDHAGVQGPLRVGAFAGSGTTRLQAGASYWGIMELSGNVYERAVTTGKTKGLAFMGTHGSGTLTRPGDWPGDDADGVGFRGGDWYEKDTYLRVSDRRNAANVGTVRNRRHGSRAVRSAPSGVGD